MQAVIRAGGKQYKVEKGDKVKIEKLDKDAGKSIKINDVLMIIDGKKVTVGTPIVKDAHVNAKIEGHGRGAKIKIVKFDIFSLIYTKNFLDSITFDNRNYVKINL